MRKQYYEYRHTVGLEETNLVGSVHLINYVRWQGQCREMFLLENAPGVLDELDDALEFRTVNSECDYVAEVGAFDEVLIRMRLEELTQTHIGFAFDFIRVRDGAEQLAGRSRQRLACVRSAGGGSTPAQVPPQLGAALEDYAAVPVTYRLIAGSGGRG
jgi:enediyne biosynthesis thioesterase